MNIIKISLTILFFLNVCFTNLYSQKKSITLQLIGYDSIPNFAQVNFDGEFIGSFKIDSQNIISLNLANGIAINNVKFGKVFTDKKKSYFAILSDSFVDLFDINGNKLFEINLGGRFRLIYNNLILTPKGELYVINSLKSKNAKFKNGIQKYDKRGKLVWEKGLDIYGRTKIFLFKPKNVILISSRDKDGKGKNIKTNFTLINLKGEILDTHTQLGNYSEISKSKSKYFAFDTRSKESIFFNIKKTKLEFLPINFTDNNILRTPFGIDEKRSKLLFWTVNESYEINIDFYDIKRKINKKFDLLNLGIKLRTPKEYQSVKECFYNCKNYTLQILTLDSRMYTFDIN